MAIRYGERKRVKRIFPARDRRSVPGRAVRSTKLRYAVAIALRGTKLLFAVAVRSTQFVVSIAVVRGMCSQFCLLLVVCSLFWVDVAVVLYGLFLECVLHVSYFYLTPAFRGRGLFLVLSNASSWDMRPYISQSPLLDLLIFCSFGLPCTPTSANPRTSTKTQQDHPT